MRKIIAAALLLAALSACAVAPSAPAPQRPTPIGSAPSNVGQLPVRTLVRNFTTVVERVEPVSEAICRQQNPRINCDFRIVVDDDPRAPPNAFQTLDRNGRPIIAFTASLINETRNQDELAFVMAHEAAHHIRGHLARARQNAQVGAAIAGLIFGGQSTASQEAAQQIGATIGARSYSKDFELEADALGTIIADAAGYNPLRGAEFFTRIPDPGNRFLGTHPANADRIATVQRVAAGL